MSRVYAVVFACLCITAVRGQDAPRPLTPADQFALQDVGEIRLSPDGATIVFSLTTTDHAANRSVSRFMRVPATGGMPAALTGVPEGANTVRWSPDSRKIAFFAARDGRTALWTYDLATETLTRVCDLPGSKVRGFEGSRVPGFEGSGVPALQGSRNTLAWSPQGDRLAFVASMDGRSRTRIHLVPAFPSTALGAGGGTPKALTKGDFDEHSIEWEGDGSEIVFLSNREPDPGAIDSSDIYAVSVTSGSVRQITKTPGVEMEPRLSPDGRWIAYTAATRPVKASDSVAEDAHIFVVSAAGGKPQELNHALDRRSSSPEWAPDGLAVIFTATDRGKTVLYRVSVKGGAPIALIDRKAQAGPYSMARNGLIAVGLTDPAMPREIFRFRPDAELRQLTWLNASTVRQWKLVTPEPISFRSFDGTDVEGWYYPAVGPLRPPEASTPMILAIHGEPHGTFGYAFNPVFQMNAARGYATLAINPRGSSGYGQAFADAALRGGDEKDLLAGVEHMLKLRPEIDPQRLTISAEGHGAVVADRLLEQTTRFKAAVASSR